MDVSYWEPGILGPGPRLFLPGQLSVEFVNVGGWLTHGDLALDSCAQFLAVAEHRSIPSRARSVCHQLRRAGRHYIWALACQDQVAGGQAGVGVASCGGASPDSPIFCHSSVSGVFFNLGRVLRTILPAGNGGVAHIFVVYGDQGAEEDADQLLLTDKLLQAVLAEAQVVCIGQPLLIAGDLNADPAVIPCLAKGISAGRYVALVLAYSLGAGLTPDVTCRFSRKDGTGSRRDFFVGCPNALAVSQACYVTDRWFTPHFSVLARFRVGAWMADVACPVVCQPVWPACWLDTPDRSSSSAAHSRYSKIIYTTTCREHPEAPEKGQVRQPPTPPNRCPTYPLPPERRTTTTDSEVVVRMCAFNVGVCPAKLTAPPPPSPRPPTTVGHRVLPKKTADPGTRRPNGRSVKKTP